MINTRVLRRMMAPLLGASLSLGGGPFAFAQSVKVEFPAKPDPSELPEVWPQEAGVDSDQLVKLSQWIRDQKLDVRSLVIVKDGKIAFERYSSGLTRDKNYELYSITKALTSVLAGHLIAEGKISLDSSVKDVIGRYRPDLKEAVADKDKVKLRNVLNMTTGLYYDFKPPNDPIYYEAADRLTLAATTKPLLEPGKVFQYMDVNPILATAMLSGAAGEKLEDYAEVEGVQTARHEALRVDPGRREGPCLGGLGFEVASSGHGAPRSSRPSVRSMGGQADRARRLDESDDDRREHALLRILLVGQQHSGRGRRRREPT